MSIAVSLPSRTAAIPATESQAVEVSVNLPGLLRAVVGGRQPLTAAGSTLAEALQDLLHRYPLLGVHLYDEDGKTRKHVLIYYNSDNIAWLDSLDVPLHPGDQLHVLQAVSGG